MAVPWPGSCPPAGEPAGSVADTIERLRRFSEGQTLGGLRMAELRDQGRR